MYSQFTIANKLPDVDNALNFQKCLVIGNYMMLVSLLIVTGCIILTFAIDEHVVISIQILAHILTIIFAGFLKIGYVLRCVALHAFGKKDF